MRLLTESQWDRYFSVLDHLTSLSGQERENAFEALRIQGHDDSHLLSLIALHFKLPPEPDRCRLGERIGSFVLSDQIGRGGMGIVYRATQDLGREVALKLIHPDFLQMDRDMAYSRYRDEVTLLARLEHSGIARIYEGGIHKNDATGESCPFFAMQLVQGGIALTHYATKNGLSVRERLELFLLVCEAIQYAHDQGVIHRDLKPSNILVDNNGRPVVIDFGLAQACNLMVESGRRIRLSGTPAYMSPEQVSDSFGQVGPVSDVYSLGIILYELLADERPYDLACDGSFSTIRQVIIEGCPTPLSLKLSETHRELVSIVEKTIEKQPEDRYPSVASLQVVLRHYLEETTPHASNQRLVIGPFYLENHRLVVTLNKGLAGRAIMVAETHEPELATVTIRFTVGTETGVFSLQPSPLTASTWCASYNLQQSFTQVMNCNPDFVVELAQPEWRQVTALLVAWPASSPGDGSSRLSPVTMPCTPSYQNITELIRCYDGCVLPTPTPNEVLAIFGIPQSQENHIQRAMLVASCLSHKVFDLTIGVATGRIYLDPRHGDTHTAELNRDVRHIHLQASSGEVVVSKSVYRAVRQDFAFLAHRERNSTPSVYRMQQRTVDHTPDKIIGRDTEIETLQTCFGDLAKGQGGLIALVGEAGVGKSRLVAEVRARMSHQVSWFESHAISYTPAMSYGPFRELLRQFAGIEPGDNDQIAKTKLSARLPKELSEQMDDILPYLLKLIGVRVSDSQAERIKYLNPEALSRQLFHAAYRLFSWLSNEQPLVLLFENWQRHDLASAELLEHLLPLTRQNPLMIWIVSRSAQQLSDGCRRLVPDQYHLISLSPLSLDESSELCNTLLTPQEMPSHIRMAILQRSQGNPFFLEEMIFAYTQPSSVRSEPVGSIPDTIESQILSRVNQLPECLKHVLQVAAVIGHQFGFTIVRDFLEVTSEQLEQHLIELQDLHFIQKSSHTIQTCAFKHDLIQEVVYQHILIEHRQHLHLRVADLMEATCPDQFELIVPQLAYHYAQANTWDKAKSYILKTGDFAREVASNSEAMRYYQQVMNTLDVQLDNAQKISLQRKMGEAVYWRGKHEEAEPLLLSALSNTASLPQLQV